MGPDAEDAARNVRDLDISQNLATDAMEVASAHQNDTVLVAEGAVSMFWVIAEVVKGPARSPVWLVTGILRLVVQGLTASAVQAKLRMRRMLRRRLHRFGERTQSLLATQDHLQRECPSTHAIELS
jgi:hypothetical protein